MSRISQTELEGYNIEMLKNMCRDCNMDNNSLNTDNKEWLIKIIMFKERITCKWLIGGYLEYKLNGCKKPEVKIIKKENSPDWNESFDSD